MIFLVNLIGGEDRNGQKSYYKRRGIIMGVITIFAAVMAFGLDRWNNTYTIIYVVMMMGTATMDSVANEMRYFTRQTVITDNRQFSFNPSGKFEAGPLLVIEVGGINITGWPKQGGEGTVVVPRELVEEQGENIRVYGSVHTVDISELDEKAREVITDHGLGEPYYQSYEMSIPGLDKIDHLFEDIDIDKLENGGYSEKTERALKKLVGKLDNIDTRLNQLQGTVDKRMEDKDDRIDGLERINRKKFKDLETAAEAGKSIAGPSKTDKIKNYFTGGGKDDREREKR